MWQVPWANTVREKKQEQEANKMKKKMILSLLSVLLLLVGAVCLAACSDEVGPEEILYVYNWG